MTDLDLSENLLTRLDDKLPVLMASLKFLRFNSNKLTLIPENIDELKFIETIEVMSLTWESK